MTPSLEFNFTGRRAIVLHPAETVRDQLQSRLAALGLRTGAQWPASREEISDADVLFVDIDSGHDDLFPWEKGAAPIPVIGLVRSEAPGRLAWALEHGFDAYLPLAAMGNVYSTLVVATAHQAKRLGRTARDAETARRNGLRHALVRAVLQIMEREGIDEIAALKQLRTQAMAGQMALEDAAVQVLSDNTPMHARRR